jgi:hypothetical protein
MTVKNLDRRPVVNVVDIGLVIVDLDDGVSASNFFDVGRGRM